MTAAPLATYRLQLSRDFTFGDTARVADYLNALAVSHIYLSPVMEAAPGSNHGYDVCDFAAISAERGGETGFRALTETIDGKLRLLLDIVPNHMATSYKNPYWRDVLAKGRESPYWPLFDLKTAADEKIKLPVLGGDLAKELPHIALGKDAAGNPVLSYGDRLFPLREGTAAGGDIRAILDEQYYELTPWQDVFRHMSYRRFFDVTGLIGVRVEDEANFRLTHAPLFALLRDYPVIDAVRVDHIDGLADPAGYLARLQQHIAPVWVEKILARDESLPAGWRAQGTTGYEFIDALNQLLVHPAHFGRIRAYWAAHVETRWPDFDACVAEAKATVLRRLFPAELARVAALSGKPADYWAALTAALPVYRAYDTGDAAITEWQQLTGPVMAKGMEDTAHYRYTPLAALNEVGCAASIDAAHDFFGWARARATRWPHALNATTTHDTKRSEDVRCRLYALADDPDRWIAFYEAALQAAPPPALIRPATAYFLYQAILGAWPPGDNIDEDFSRRLVAYMQKAAREAKQETSWLDPASEYEGALTAFVPHILADEKFVALAGAFAARLSFCGALNSLTAQALKILSPGVPDIYQGTEGWAFSLVDPDNRRPVDFARHAALLAEADALDRAQGRAALLRRLTQNWRDGAIKLWTTQALLRIRRDYLTDGPLTIDRVEAVGERADNLLAWTIRCGGKTLLAAAPRYPGLLLPETAPDSLTVAGWGDTAIPLDGPRRNLITGETATGTVEALFSDFPIAVLVL